MWLQKLGHCEQSELTIELIIEFGLRVPENRISVGGPTVCNCNKGDWTAPGVKTINCLSKSCGFQPLCRRSITTKSWLNNY